MIPYYYTISCFTYSYHLPIYSPPHFIFPAEDACTTHMKAPGMFNQCIIVYFILYFDIMSMQEPQSI